MTRRILIAEDDDLQGALLKDALTTRGYEAELATNGLEAIRRLRSGCFDLALIDYKMPEIDGFAAARLIREMFAEEQRPRLIAVTAAAEGLHERAGLCAESCFDTIVSKQVSLPALLKVIEANLPVAARSKTAMATPQTLEAVAAPALRHRRLRAMLAGGPSLLMAAAFTGALGWSVASLSSLDKALDTTLRASALSAGTGALIDTMHGAETSQLRYLATGQDADRQRFEAQAQQLDRILASPASLAADGSPGFGEATEPQWLVESRLRSLTEEANLRGARGSAAAAASIAVSDGEPAAERLRGWASAAVGGTLAALHAGLGTVRDNILPVLAVLALGILTSAWTAWRTVARSWRWSSVVAGGAIFRRMPEASLPPHRPQASLVLSD